MGAARKRLWLAGPLRGVESPTASETPADDAKMQSTFPSFVDSPGHPVGNRLTQGCASERESHDMAEDNFRPTSIEGFGPHVGEPSTAAHNHLQPPMPSTLFQGAHLQHTCSTLAAHLQVTANQLSIAPVNAVCLFCLIPWENWKRVWDQNLNPHPSPLGCPGLSQPPPLPGSMGGGVTEPGEGQVTQIYFGL